MNEWVMFLVVTLAAPSFATLALVLYVVEKKVKTHVLFLCNDNAGRSQMSHAYMAQRYGMYFHVESAGINPRGEVDPVVKQVLKQKGLAHQITKPRGIDRSMARAALKVLEDTNPGVRKCLGESGHLFDWSQLKDPSGKSVAEVEAIYEEIVERIEKELVPYLADRRKPSKGANLVRKQT